MRYYEFDADYCAIIGAQTEDEAIGKYIEEIGDVGDVVISEITKSQVIGEITRCESTHDEKMTALEGLEEYSLGVRPFVILINACFK